MVFAVLEGFSTLRFDAYAQDRLGVMRMVFGHTCTVFLLLVVTIQADSKGQAIGFRNETCVVR